MTNKEKTRIGQKTFTSNEKGVTIHQKYLNNGSFFKSKECIRASITRASTAIAHKILKFNIFKSVQCLVFIASVNKVFIFVDGQPVCYQCYFN